MGERSSLNLPDCRDCRHRDTWDHCYAFGGTLARNERDDPARCGPFGRAFQRKFGGRWQWAIITAAILLPLAILAVT